MNDDKFVSQISDAEALGDLGEAHLEVDTSVSPRILPCRQVSLALQEEVKCELDNLVKRRVDTCGRTNEMGKPNGYS